MRRPTFCLAAILSYNKKLQNRAGRSSHQPLVCIRQFCEPFYLSSLILTYFYPPISPTCSVRSATGDLTRQGPPSSYFNPRTPQGMRWEGERQRRPLDTISPHTSRGGCDSRTASIPDSAFIFQSTHPAGDVTVCSFGEICLALAGRISRSGFLLCERL